MMKPSDRNVSVGALAVATLLSWGTLYYTFPVLASKVHDDTGWAPGLLAGVYSASLVAAAIVGVPLGKIIDHSGDLRKVMPWMSLIGAGGLVLSTVGPLWVFILGWVIVGAAHAGTLWGPAFIAITRWFRAEQGAKPIMLITAVGGSASLIFAPLTAALATQYGWQVTTIILAIGYLALSLPLQLLGFRRAWQVEQAPRKTAAQEVRKITRQPSFLFLQLCMVTAGIALFGVTLNLVEISEERGASYFEAAFIFGLVGLGQVLGRIGMTLIPLPASPKTRLRILLLAAAAVLALLAFAPPVFPLALLATISGALRGWHTLMMRSGVLERWGPVNFGTIMGHFNMPVAIGIAFAPVVGSLVSSALGGFTIGILVIAVLVGLCTLLVGKT